MSKSIKFGIREEKKIQYKDTEEFKMKIIDF